MGDSKPGNARGFLQVYSLVSCFFASVIMMVCVVLFGGRVAAVLKPGVLYGAELVKFQSGQDYLDDLERQIRDGTCFDPELKKRIEAKYKQCIRIKPEEMENLVRQEKEHFLARQRASDLSSFPGISLWFSGALLFLLIHVFVYRRARQRGE